MVGSWHVAGVAVDGECDEWRAASSVEQRRCRAMAGEALATQPYPGARTCIAVAFLPEGPLGMQRRGRAGWKLDAFDPSPGRIARHIARGLNHLPSNILNSIRSDHSRSARSLRQISRWQSPSTLRIMGSDARQSLFFRQEEFQTIR